MSRIDGVTFAMMENGMYILMLFIFSPNMECNNVHQSFHIQLPKRYEYYARVANCSHRMFRSSYEDCQNTLKHINKVEVGQVETSYIDDCEVGSNFAWGWDLKEYQKRENLKALWMIIPISIICFLMIGSACCKLVG